MRVTQCLLLRAFPAQLSSDLISIRNATFYRDFPAPGGEPKPLFQGLTLSIPAKTKKAIGETWAVIGASSSGKSTLLDILRGGLLCQPPNARLFPYLDTVQSQGGPNLRDPRRAIQYVGFGDANDKLSGSAAKGAYLSARYESRREATDFSLLDYLRGNLSLSPTDEELKVAQDPTAEQSLDEIATLLKLKDLLELPVGNLSNGQTRRARIAKALLRRPLALLLDEPFLSLDPRTAKSLGPLLRSLSDSISFQLVLSLQPDVSIPRFVSHVLHLGEDCSVHLQGPKDEVLAKLNGEGLSPTEPVLSSEPAIAPPPTSNVPSNPPKSASAGQKRLVRMRGVVIKHGAKRIIGNWFQPVQDVLRSGLWWKVKRGERWGLFGPNGSGKTTLLALISSDHPQAYSQPVLVFGRSRLPTPERPGISIFDLQARIGQSSPEILNFFPQHLSLRRTIESAWADTFVSKPALNAERTAAVEACLRWFQLELNPAGAHAAASDDLAWAESTALRFVSFSAQKVALLVRALIKKPDLVILDEAFSGMDAATRRKCMAFLTHGIPPADRAPQVVSGLEGRQALLCVSHRPEEVPPVVRRWICLPEPGGADRPRFGLLDRNRDENGYGWWDKIWGV